MITNINRQYIQENIVKILTNNNYLSELLTEKIYHLEFQSQLFSEYSTYRSTMYRNCFYKSFNERFALRKKVLNELISYCNITNEKNIHLGIGGCKPITYPTHKKFFLLIGLPSSGKSYIANIISLVIGAYIIDSDYAKRKFPEFSISPCASSLLHEEANKITYSKLGKSLFNYCLNCKYSMVMSRVGHISDSLTSHLLLLNDHGYDIYLIFIDINVTESILSSYQRFCITGRYIPLCKIIYEYKSLPEKTYHFIKQKEYMTGYAWIKTNIKREYNILEKNCLDQLIHIISERKM